VGFNRPENESNLNFRNRNLNNDNRALGMAFVKALFLTYKPTIVFMIKFAVCKPPFY